MFHSFSDSPGIVAGGLRKHEEERPSRMQIASWSGTIRLRKDVDFPLGRKDKEGTAFLNLIANFYAPADPVCPSLHPVVALLRVGGSPLMEIL
jgi:hypothetical protein